jgi:hypothetical protein
MDVFTPRIGLVARVFIVDETNRAHIGSFVKIK